MTSRLKGTIMRKGSAFVAAVLLLCTTASSAFGRYVWTWDNLTVIPASIRSGDSNLLTSNNGAHAVGLAEYDNASKAWVSILSERRFSPPAAPVAYAYEYRDMGWNQGWTWLEAPSFPYKVEPGNYTHRPTNGGVEVNSSNKLLYALFRDIQDDDSPLSTPAIYVRAQYVSDQTQDIWHPMQRWTETNEDTMVACVMRRSTTDACLVQTLHYNNSEEDYNFWALQSRYSTNGGVSWNTRFRSWASRLANSKGQVVNPSLAVNDATDRLYLAYDDNGDGQANPGIYLKCSVDSGKTWPVSSLMADGQNAVYSEPCIAAILDTVFACWTAGKAIVYVYSTNGGVNWLPTGGSPPAIPFGNTDFLSFDRPNVTAERCGGYPGVLIVCRVKDNTPTLRGTRWAVRGQFGLFRGGKWYWSSQPPMCSQAFLNEADEPLNPSIASDSFSDDPSHCNGYPHACFVMSCPWISGRSIWRRGAYFAQTDKPAVTSDANTARLVAEDANGVEHYASATWPYYTAGDIAGQSPFYSIAGNGWDPALAIDDAGQSWVAFVNGDSLFCHCSAEPTPRLVFAGSCTAVPGQPSIVCYSEQATSGYCAGVVFPVYDTAGGASKIMFARVDTSAVVLDTIESVANLRDSLPCISIYKTDTLLATFQHGDSILSVLLADYGPGSTGRPSAWSSPNLVTASGYHAMSTFEQGGSVLNCVWSGKSGNNYAIHRATIDLSGGMFPSWTAQSDPSSNAATEVSSAVYAGLGVTCWQAKVNNKWVIKGMVRGEEETFVANDTDAYHPHAVAESSAISPSIDQVRVHLLWTEGVTFEVDSGVTDTGETRYKCESLSVSRAGSDATKSNTGAKLLRKALSDSLFCTYTDLDGTVMYARSAAGDSWHRDVMVTSRDWPAIAEDSSGKRWVVVHKVNVGGTQTQEAYYRNGSSWTGPQTLYSSQPNGTLGPASLAGSSYTTSGIAYAAFLLTPSIGPKSVVLAKFNGSVVATYTVASGTSLGDPTLAVEPYKQDSDHVHVSWVDNGVVKYCMDTDGRSSSIASKWTSTFSLSNAQVTSTHPCIAADRDQIVAAWAQGATTEIYSRKRSTGSAYNNWESEVNLSNTSTASDYPTIAMGDTVIVVWEEHRTVSDFDVLASINFGDTINIADNATKSGYPHVLFQNKTSGDTAIPYLHVIWSETPEANVYEVAYNRHNLKQSGEGQQSAGQTPLPRKPMLAACRPNPFRDKTTIAYQLPQAGNVSLCVYDVTGRTVRTLQRGYQKPGEYSVSWDSKDSRGRQVPRGVYFYRLDTPGFRDVKKAVVAR